MREQLNFYTIFRIENTLSILLLISRNIENTSLKQYSICGKNLRQ